MHKWWELALGGVALVGGFFVGRSIKRSLDEKTIEAFRAELYDGTCGYPAHWGH